MRDDNTTHCALNLDRRGSAFKEPSSTTSEKCNDVKSDHKDLMLPNSNYFFMHNLFSMPNISSAVIASGIVLGFTAGLVMGSTVDLVPAPVSDASSSRPPRSTNACRQTDCNVSLWQFAGFQHGSTKLCDQGIDFLSHVDAHELRAKCRHSLGTKQPTAGANRQAARRGRTTEPTSPAMRSQLCAAGAR